jgi:Porin PorA
VKGRFVGTVLVGIGVLFAVLAAGLPLFVAPAVTKLPYDLALCPQPPKAAPKGCLKPTVAEAVNATFLQLGPAPGQIEVDHADLRGTTEVVPKAKLTADEQKAGRVGDNAVVWDVFQTAQRIDNGYVVSSSSTELALDRVSAAGVNWSGQWLDDSGTKDTSVRYSDQIYKFPFNTAKRDYKIFDQDLRKPFPAVFKGTDTIEGLEVYRFESVVNEQALTVDPESLGTLLSTFAPGASAGQVLYSNVRTVWVEPTTGTYIKVREQQHKKLVPGTGGETVLLDADFVYTPDTIKSSAQSAKGNRLQVKAISVYGPVALGILSLILLVGGFLLIGRGGAPSRSAEPAAWDATLPRPRDGLRGEAQTEANSTGPLSDILPRSTAPWGRHSNDE